MTSILLRSHILNCHVGEEGLAVRWPAEVRSKPREEVGLVLFSKICTTHIIRRSESC